VVVVAVVVAVVAAVIAAVIAAVVAVVIAAVVVVVVAVVVAVVIVAVVDAVVDVVLAAVCQPAVTESTIAEEAVAGINRGSEATTQRVGNSTATGDGDTTTSKKIFFNER